MTSAPYPADTRAKGWRFELDYEQIEQSDTWPLAAEVSMAQHALLMMWVVAWAQTPCGSFPVDEEIIRAKCRIPPAMWEPCRPVLMRGWWEADDGRLYHPTLTKRVLEMMARRRSDADRQAAKRAREAADSAGVTTESRVTSAGVRPESSTDHRIPTTPPTEESRARARSPARPDDVAEQVWKDWLELRKKKRAPVTATVLKESRLEAGKAGMPLERFLAVWCGRGSQGLQAEWLRPDERGNGETAWQRNQRERVAEMTGGLVSSKPPGGARPLGEVIHDSPFAIVKR